VSGALKCPIIAAMFHRGITALIGHLQNTHPLTLAKADQVGRVSLASDRTDGRRKNMLPMGISASRQ